MSCKSKEFHVLVAFEYYVAISPSFTCNGACTWLAEEEDKEEEGARMAGACQGKGMEEAFKVMYPQISRAERLLRGMGIVYHFQRAALVRQLYFNDHSYCNENGGGLTSESIIDPWRACVRKSVLKSESRIFLSKAQGHPGRGVPEPLIV